ncbi:MAG: response regulator [Kiritimatiellia bacterium]
MKTASPTHSALSPTPEGCGYILVVEDEPALQVVSRLQLNKLGCTATIVSSGEEAVSLFTSAKVENRPSPFDLVLMDMVMPGLDGLTTSRHIRNLYPDQRITIVSGYPPDTHTAEINQLGLFWLVKPYSFTDLSESIRAAVTRSVRAFAAPCASGS